ncbi:MAG: ParA family protein [Oligoflexia bacterium]|nr:ParA family protein [Oligoflexia bacterium]
MRDIINENMNETINENMNKINLTLTTSVKKISEIFKVTPQAIHKLIKECGIIFKKIGGSVRITSDNFQDILKAKNIKKQKMIICSSCVKGGVGKTTLTHGLASIIPSYGHKTLVIDLDKQSNLTSHLSIIPSNLSVAAFESDFAGQTENVERFFKNLLAPIENDFDVIWFDCPPALVKVTSAAQACSDLVLIPINTDKFSMDGLELTIDSILTLNKKFDVNPDIKIVINKFDARQKLAFQIIGVLLNGDYKNYFSNTFISISKQIVNCIANKSCLWDQKYKGLTQDNSTELTQEILGANKWSLLKTLSSSLTSSLPSFALNKQDLPQNDITLANSSISYV